MSNLRYKPLKWVVIWAVMGVTIALLICFIWPSSRQYQSVLQQDVGATAILTSLPIFVPETMDINQSIQDIAGPGTERHALGQYWEKTLTPQRYDDVMAAIAMDPDLLILAQPRPMMPEALVQLDDWVSEGGSVLIFADPALFWPSIFPFGDARRPEGATLLSPLFAHWGLEQRFDDDQPQEQWLIEAANFDVAVIQSGHFGTVPPIQDTGGVEADCDMLGDGLVAKCLVGKGHAVIVADADLLQQQFYEGALPQSGKALPANGNWRAVNHLVRLALQ